MVVVSLRRLTNLTHVLTFNLFHNLAYNTWHPICWKHLLQAKSLLNLSVSNFPPPEFVSNPKIFVKESLMDRSTHEYMLKIRWNIIHTLLKEGVMNSIIGICRWESACVFIASKGTLLQYSRSNVLSAYFTKYANIYAFPCKIKWPCASSTTSPIPSISHRVSAFIINLYWMFFVWEIQYSKK